MLPKKLDYSAVFSSEGLDLSKDVGMLTTKHQIVDEMIRVAESKTLSDEEKAQELERLDPHQRHRKEAERKLLAAVNAQDRKLAADRKEFAEQEQKKLKDLARQRSLVRSLEAYAHWEEVETTQFILEKNDCSRLHKLQECFYKGDFYDVATQSFLDAQVEFTISGGVFVVRHDWARAFGDNLNDSDLYKLPYEECAFEFRVTGHTIIVDAKMKGEEVHYSVMLEGVDGIWLLFGDKELAEIKAFVVRQIRAICIALEAEVAQHQTVKAPGKLNAKRLKDNKPPLADYHVVDLAQRLRGERGSASQPYKGVVRLHWRRGHWHRYGGEKKWQKWLLVGNPDLGFIDKHYRI
jgi:hypothetical protein